jgi:hypothetical protein
VPFEVMFTLALVFVSMIWLGLLMNWGHVKLVGSGGILFKPLLGPARDVKWEKLRGPAKIYRSFLPRVILDRRREGLQSLLPSYVVLLRFDERDQQLLQEIERRFKLEGENRFGF